MTLYRVSHRTDYAYGRPMADGFTVAYLLPRDTVGQRVVASELVVEPEADEWEQSTDMFGNRVVRFAVHHPHERLSISTVSEVEVHPPVEPVSAIRVSEALDRVARARHGVINEIGPFVTRSPLVPALPALRSLVDDLIDDDPPVVELARRICHLVFTDFTFDPHATDVATPIAEVLEHRHGVCQDFAHVAIGCIRSIGLPARYVSGYIETLPPPGRPRLIGADASHAWCSVWVPGLGWIDMDPTNDQLPPQRHITVAWGRDYSDVAPVRGVVIGPATTQQLEVSVDVAHVGVG